MDNEKHIVSTCWNNYGESEPYWSVITSDVYKMDTIDEASIEKFYHSGQGDIKWCFSMLPKSFVPREGKVLDYGCGVGRLTYWVNGGHGCDISQNHIDIAIKKCPTNTFHLVEPGQMPHGYEYDLIFSFIVLQHCRPNLIRECVKNILDALTPNGYALLHIPYHMNILDISHNVNVMEMHFVPKEDICLIAKTSKCTIEAIHETDRCGKDIKNCVYVIKKGG